MNHIYTYKFRLKPTEDQKILLAKHFGCCRYVYNYFLDKRIKKYKKTKKGSTYCKDSEQLPALKKKLPWLKEVSAQSVQHAVRNLDTAYKNFFKRIAQGSTKKGFPKFKSKNKKDSFRITQNVIVKENKVIIRKFLEGIEYIPDPRNVEGTIKFATITKNKAEQYFVSISTSIDIQPLPEMDTAIGLDMNKKDIVDSNGNHYINPCPAKKHRKQMRILQKALDRTKKGTKNKPESNGRKEARIKLAKLHLHIHNVREDYLHKLSKKLVDENQVICIEDLSVKSMLKNVPIEKRKQYRSEEKRHHQEISDAGWRSLRTKLEYKSEWYGRNLVAIDRYYPSSQICSHCRWQYKDLPNNCKEWCCWNCFEWNNRDENAATNIVNEGLYVFLGTENQAACPDVRPAFSGLYVGAETHL